MKSQEQRIEDAARAMCGSDWSRVSVHIQEDWRERARRALEAADRESPKWPTDESFKAVFSSLTREDAPVSERQLRDAFLADPIIKAAIAYRDAYTATRVIPIHKALLDAVNEAGL